MARTTSLIALLTLIGCGASPSEAPQAGDTGKLVDQDGDGKGPKQGDCNDRDATIYHGAPETTGDGVDSNCDQLDRQTRSATTAAVTFTPAPNGEDWFAGKALAIQDINADGFGDVVVGAPGFANAAGHSRVFVGLGKGKVAEVFDVVLSLGLKQALGNAS